MKNLLIRLTFLFALALPFSTLMAQDKKEKEKKVGQLVESKNFIFVAQSVFPQSGLSRQLTSAYDLRIAKDTIISHLPYFGRAYTAPVYPGEGGIMFQSVDFTYEVKARKKGGWQILINPEDAGDVRQMFLNISPGGSASLQVTSDNRQTISFNGYIMERK